MKSLSVLMSAALLALAVVLGTASDRPAKVEVARLSERNWDEFVPAGKEVDAIYGDFVLRNQHLIAVIAQPLATRNANMTVKDVGGALIDLTDRKAQSDQLSAFYPGRRKYPFRAASGRDADGKDLNFDSAESFSSSRASISVRAESAEDRPDVEVTYSLSADDPFLSVTTKYSNPGKSPRTVDLQDDLRADSGKEDMLKSPNGVSQLVWIHDLYWGQAYGVEAVGMKIESNSNTRDSVLKYQQASGDDSLTLQPGQAFELTRRIFAGSSLLDVKARVGASHGEKYVPVEFELVDSAGRAISRAQAEFSKGGESVGSAMTDAAGRITTSLPPGEYRLSAKALGVVVAGGEKALAVRVAESDEVQRQRLALSDYQPGKVAARITDSAGQPIPCKVEFVAKPGTPQPDFGPESADFAVKNLCYAPLGEFTQELPPGQYDVVISHGPEFDAIFTELTVPPGKQVPLTGHMVRSFETPGWISSDFHSHSSPSGDNTSSQLGRVANLVCEHIEFAPCTEHNRISTYDPHIEHLQIGAFIATTTGLELTGQPLPLNHQNVFPLKHRPRTQDGGAPVTDVDPERQIERLALWDDRSDKLIQQNHPDIGWLFYDRDGDGKSDSGFERSLPLMDVIEIHPIPNALRLEPIAVDDGRKENNRVFNWLQLLNQGFRIPGVVNTDAHYNFHGSGGLRIWIQSSTDDPARIDAMEMVHAAEQGRVIMSNGPYLEVSLGEAGKPERVTAGQDLEAKSGKVALHVRVQCPNWFDVDRVVVLVNGREYPQHNYSREKTPDRFRAGVAKFDEVLNLELSSDAHVVVVTGGEKLTLGRVLGPYWGAAHPTALSNPIFVDVDGGGFRANKDTLGHPLPVKFK